ncbi:hypothetical protein Nepgr_014009 [Nepenthes gracilis]|uniref:non-specific serine/threonine protein kinase n=1 Tax=Nepenthes gracilis TaxID=150966 RepID=A0AAD3SIR3_NEPGR|nr:hypothetical protein Nepgr_014009 [Nepenthes gracilis]
MEPWVDDVTDDLQSMSFASTATDAIPRSTSSSSETTWTTTSSSLPNTTTTTTKPRATISGGGDPLWDAIRGSGSASSPILSFSDVRFLCRLGSGDIGAVYLAELKWAEGVHFAAKVMDNKELATRNKEGRARTEREILEMLDHPFLPTLFATLESPKWSCLLTEFCPGGDLHVLRQRQTFKRFEESAVRFYASEVIVALEYVHMMGIVYRDLKPENVLVRSDGHIMLTDFDLSLKCDDESTPTPQIILHQSQREPSSKNGYPPDQPSFASSSCILPNCIVPAVSCFRPKRRRRKKKPSRCAGPEIVAEPMDVRSMSFVGTHEYLAPEIVSGEGHGSAVDWWTLGIFIFELFYGVTPFKGVENELTLANIVARALEFPKEPTVPAAAKDLISQLLVKDPAGRLGSTMGSSPIKQHPFFQGVNWALLRCTAPPFVPPPFSSREIVSDDSCPDTPVEYY